MTALGFIPLTLGPNAPEQELVGDLWAMLKCEKVGGAAREALRVCLLAVIGVSLKERTKDAEKEKKEPKEDDEEEAEESSEDWGFYDDDNEFFFRPREQ